MAFAFGSLVLKTGVGFEEAGTASVALRIGAGFEEAGSKLRAVTTGVGFGFEYSAIAGAGTFSTTRAGAGDRVGAGSFKSAAGVRRAGIERTPAAERCTMPADLVTVRFTCVGVGAACRASAAAASRGPREVTVDATGETESLR